MSNIARSVAALFVSLSFATFGAGCSSDKQVAPSVATPDAAGEQELVPLELPADARYDQDLLNIVAPVVPFGVVLEVLEPQALCAVQGLSLGATGSCEAPAQSSAS